ncbi:MAG: sensor histidine kinase [Burkholderiaceae bacterium]
MHPLLADVRKLFWYVLAWELAGVGIAALLHLAGQARWLGALTFALPVCGVYAFAALSSYYVCRSLPWAQRRWPVALALFGGAALLSALAWLGLGEAWNTVGRLGDRNAPLVALSSAGWVLYFVAGFVLYLLSLLAHDVLIAFETVQDAARREAESRVLARDAELQMLRTQINPHFLFNSLNSISALTSMDPAAARDMTIDLAQFFRRTLALAERHRIALGEEVALSEHFLSIEQRRFGAKLRAQLRVAPDAAGCLLPPMTLQPLLENAIKHGIRQLDDGGTITVEAVVRDGWLHVSVDNPVGEAADAGARGHGMGLRNIRERLAALYGSRAYIAWGRAEGRFTAEITLPAERQPTPNQQEDRP